MSVIEIAALIVAVAFAALVGFLVPVLIEARKAVAEAEQGLVRINAELLPLLSEMRTTMANLNELVEKTRDSVDHATILLHAAGEVGESVHQLHEMVRGTGGSMVRNVMNMVFAGIQAATAVFSGRASARKS
jgi:uncharacterized protein YoxC